MKIYVIAATAVAIGAFVFGRLIGFRKSARRGWTISKIGQKYHADLPTKSKVDIA
jgi:hypothetical protein